MIKFFNRIFLKIGGGGSLENINVSNKSIPTVLNEIRKLMFPDMNKIVEKQLKRIGILVIPAFAIEKNKVKIVVAAVCVFGWAVADSTSYNVIILRAVIIEKNNDYG